MIATVYLDVDDEITSAAARIRNLPDERIALVLPLGSRLATSRINFRLLAREAETHGKRIEIVTNDASARALAASAGLATHLSVAALEGSSGVSAQPALAIASPDAPPPTPGPAPAATPGADSPTLVLPALSPPAERAAAVPEVGRRPPRRQGPVIATILLLVGLVAAGGTAAFLLLPSAEIILIPASDAVGPLELNVTAQAGVTQPDPVNLLVPAKRFTFDVNVSETFPASGTKVTETAATGEVTFSSLNTGGTNTIAAGAIVRTESGIGFRTLAEVQLPPAQIGIVDSAFVIIPSTRTVAIEAVTPGESGNVDANTIVVVPEGENPLRTIVKNEAATGGGTHAESLVIQQSDVDFALSSLDDELAAAFEAQVASPPGVPAGTTLFPGTRLLGAVTPSTDPTSLVGSEVAQFDLGLTAQGAVLGVDRGPVSTLADARIRSAVDDGFRLDESSIKIDVGDPIVAGSVITFPVTVRATELRTVDGAGLLAQVRGLGLPQARTVLGEFGEVEITVWPDWVTTIPTAGGRATLTIRGPLEPSASPGATSSGTASP